MPAILKTAAGRVFGAGAVLAFAAWWTVNVFRERWAVRIPDERHTYGIRVRGGVDLFFPPWLGWFMDHALWIVLALVIVAVAAEWWNRRQGRSPLADQPGG
jgi:hypothetical protein